MNIKHVKEEKLETFDPVTLGNSGFVIVLKAKRPLSSMVEQSDNSFWNRKDTGNMRTSESLKPVCV